MQLSYVIFLCFYYWYAFKAVVWLYSACKNTSAALYIKTTNKKTNKQLNHSTTFWYNAYMSHFLLISIIVLMSANNSQIWAMLTGYESLVRGFFKSLSWRNDLFWMVVKGYYYNYDVVCTCQDQASCLLDLKLTSLLLTNDDDYLKKWMQTSIGTLKGGWW